jgi:glycosyltransferase involved in cell wall biosynthesis
MLISSAESWSARQVEEIYVLTDDDRLYLEQNVPSSKVKVLNSFGVGCDLKRFDRERISPQIQIEIKDKWGIKEVDFVYVFIGRQTHFKGFDKVVHAFIEVKKTHPNSKLLLVGEKDRIHPTGLDSETEELLNSDPSFIHVGWRENVQDFLAVSHLNVFPSEREGLPVNLMESLAMGVPVVTTDSRGCREVVQDGVNGLVLNSHETGALASAMRDLQDNAEVLAAYAEAAQAGRSKFDRKKFIQSQFEMIERITGKPV